MLVWGLLMILQLPKVLEAAAEWAGAFIRGRPGPFLPSGLVFLDCDVAAFEKSSLKQEKSQHL